MFIFENFCAQCNDYYIPEFKNKQKKNKIGSTYFVCVKNCLITILIG